MPKFPYAENEGGAGGLGGSAPTGKTGLKKSPSLGETTDLPHAVFEVL